MSPRRADAMPASTAEAGAFLTRRRVIRWVILLTLAVLVFLACWQDPVHAATGTAMISTPAPAACPTAVPVDGTAAVPDAVLCAAPVVRVADVDVPAAGHASITALLIGAGMVALLFTLVTLSTLRRR